MPYIVSYVPIYGPYIYLTDDWQDYEWELINNPHTGLPWTAQELNDMELGVILFNWEAPGTYCSHLYAAVHRTP